MNLLYKKIFIFSSIALLISSCGKESLDSSQVTIKSAKDIKTINGLTSVMHGALNHMTNPDSYGRNIIIYGETYADNTYANGTSGRFISISDSDLNKNTDYSKLTWEKLYQVVSSANLMLSAKIDYKENEKGRYNHLLGEAYFFRAMAHFDLLRFYGQQNVDLSAGLDALGVPYEKVFHPEGEALLSKRLTVGEVKQNLYEDLERAIKLADPKYDYPGVAYVNSEAIKALFIRVALYFKDYKKVIEFAQPLISKYQIQNEENYVKGWTTKLSSNWIFALNNNESDNPGIDGLSHMYQNTGYGDIVAYSLVKDLFEKTDIRGLKSMIKDEKGYRNYGKYPLNNPATYQLPIFRIEEVILSYAEALYFTSDTSNALVEFNKINKVRGSSQITSLNEDIIIEQWRREFYFEGFRLHTLARFGKSIEIAKKSIPYGNYKYAFPIPQAEINRSNLQQNKGY